MAARRPRFLRTLLLRSTLQKLALLFVVWTVIEAHLSYYRIARSERESRAKAVLHKHPRVFIASLHWNNEKILRTEWNRGVVELVKTLGAENTFVSVYESGSWDNSKGALRELDQALEKTGVGKRIVLDEETHQDLISGQPEEEGWIKIPDGKSMPRRIPYLSKLRNLSLQPLRELAGNGTNFDYVLFLGDVVFTVRQPSRIPVFPPQGNLLTAPHRSPTFWPSCRPITAITRRHAPSTSANRPCSTTRSPSATPTATSTSRRSGPTSAPPNPDTPWSTPSPSPSPAAGTG